MSAAENVFEGNEEKEEEVSQEKLQQLQDLVQKMDRAETRLWSSISRLHNLEATLTVLQEAEALILEVNKRLEKKLINRNGNTSCSDTSSSKINLKGMNKAKNINHVFDISNGDKTSCSIKTNTKSIYESSTSNSDNCIKNRCREDSKNILPGNYRQSNPHTSLKNNSKRCPQNSSNNNDNYTINRHSTNTHRHVNNKSSKSRDDSRKKHKFKSYQDSNDYRERKHKYRHSKNKDITNRHSSDRIKFCNKDVQLLASVGACNLCINTKEKSFVVCQKETSKSSKKGSNKHHLGNVSNLHNPHVKIGFFQTSDKNDQISKKAALSLDLRKNEQKTVKEKDAHMSKLIDQEKKETCSKPKAANHRRKCEKQLSEKHEVQDVKTPVKKMKEVFSTPSIVNHGVKYEVPKVQTSMPPLQKIREIFSTPRTANLGIKPSEETEGHNFKPLMKKKESSSISASKSVKCSKSQEQPEVQSSKHPAKGKNESSTSASKSVKCGKPPEQPEVQSSKPPVKGKNESYTSASNSVKCEKSPEQPEVQSFKHPMKGKNESSISASKSVKCGKPPEQPEVESSKQPVKGKNESSTSASKSAKCEKPPEQPEVQSSKHPMNGMKEFSSISTSESVKCGKPSEVQSFKHPTKRKNESSSSSSSASRGIKYEKPPEKPEAQSSEHSENRKKGKIKKNADDQVDGLPIPILINGTRFATSTSGKGILMYPPARKKQSNFRAGTDYEMRSSHIPFEFPVYPSYLQNDLCTTQTSNFSSPSSFPFPGHSANSATTRNPLVPLTNILFPEHFPNSQKNTDTTHNCLPPLSSVPFKEHPQNLQSNVIFSQTHSSNSECKEATTRTLLSHDPPSVPPANISVSQSHFSPAATKALLPSPPSNISLSEPFKHLQCNPAAIQAPSQSSVPLEGHTVDLQSNADNIQIYPSISGGSPANKETPFSDKTPLFTLPSVSFPGHFPSSQYNPVFSTPPLPPSNVLFPGCPPILQSNAVNSQTHSSNSEFNQANTQMLLNDPPPPPPASVSLSQSHCNPAATQALPLPQPNTSFSEHFQHSQCNPATTMTPSQSSVPLEGHSVGLQSSAANIQTYPSVSDCNPANKTTPFWGNPPLLPLPSVSFPGHIPNSQYNPVFSAAPPLPPSSVPFTGWPPNLQSQSVNSQTCLLPGLSPNLPSGVPFQGHPPYSQSQSFSTQPSLCQSPVSFLPSPFPFPDQ